MAYEVKTWVPGETEDDWDTALAIFLEDQAANGWELCGMSERTVQVAQAGGMVATTREERHMVLVFYRP